MLPSTWSISIDSGLNQLEFIVIVSDDSKAGEMTNIRIQIPGEQKWQRHLNLLMLSRYLRSLGLHLERDEGERIDISQLTY